MGGEAARQALEQSLALEESEDVLEETRTALRYIDQGS
jgi:hypothetical protein